HDLALILGLPYYMGFVIESGLKSFAYSHLKTISLDQYYQPHCNWSFPNISVEEWDKNLNIITIEVEKK
nr:CO dehydrogenase/acetyl-CoA synthase complex subunit epsilon [Candidatus Aenigmarchaeota archaeon]